MNKIKWFKSPYNLCEESQTTGIIFSFVTKEGKQCHPWIKCRDFLTDAVGSTVTGKAFKIFGFNFDLKDKAYSPVCLDKTLMLVSQQELLNVPTDSMPHKGLINFEAKMLSALRLLHHYEDIAGEDRSVMYKRRDGTKWYWLFESSPFWMKSSALVSMYSYLIRLGDKNIKFKNMRELQLKYKQLTSMEELDKDLKYLKVCRKKLYFVVKRAKKILLEGGDIDNDYMETEKVSDLHNYGGIKSICSTPTVYFNKTKAAAIFNGVV